MSCRAVIHKSVRRVRLKLSLQIRISLGNGHSRVFGLRCHTVMDHNDLPMQQALVTRTYAPYSARADTASI